MKPLISLDVFDTAIFRKVYNPNDIFNIVADEVGNNFKTLRMVAQDTVRKKDIFYNLIDIYRAISTSFNPKEEIRAEYENCYANPYILDMYNNEEADFIFISDMYLPSTVIKSILEKCGYREPKVYVSCELKALKGSGLLFTKVEEIIGRKISKHIGDNYQADILGAQKAHIPNVEFIGPPVYNKEVYTPALINVKLRKLLIVNEMSSYPIGEKIGYLFTPLILSFTKSVLKEASEGQTIFFNARDGFILYIVARWLLKTNKNIRYCRFSRKSCHFPNISTNYKIDSEQNRKAMNFFRSLRINNIKEFIDMFDFKNDYSRTLKELGIKEDSHLNYSTQKNKVIEKFVVAAQDEIFAKARESRKNFKVYINKLGMKSGDIFIDLGHFGSMQSIIRNITGISLKGRYIHKFENKDYFNGITEDKTSFLPIGFIKMYTGIVELIFSEPVGTCVSYSADGNVLLNKDTKYRKEITKSIVKGALRGVKDLIEEGIEPPYDDILSIMERFLKFPTLEEANFGNSKLFENGSYDKNESIVWYDKELIKKGKLKECYTRSYWKEAFKLLMENDKEFKSLMRFIK